MLDRIRVSQSEKMVQIKCNIIGPSQMALEDLGLFRSVPDSVVLYPSDAISAERAVELAANHRGMVYIRTSRPDAKLLYDNNEVF